MSESAASPLRLPALTLAAYAAPMAPLGALYFPVFVYVVPYYASQGADLALLSLFMVMARLLDGVSDPLMGVLSDRTPGPWGRRRPWIAAAGPLILLSSWFLFLPPENPSAIYAGIALAALTLAWTMALTPYQAWGAELSGDYAERARITSWREAVGLFGMLSAAILYTLAGNDEGQGLANIFLALAAVLPLAFLAALWKAPEPRNLSRRRLPFKEGLRIAAGNRPFMRLLLSWFVNGAANALPAALFFFFVEHRLESDNQTAGTLLVLYFLAAILGAPLWSWAAKRAPKHRVWCGVMAYACLVFAAALLLGPGDVAAFTAISILSGFALGADLSLPPAMQADVVDADAAEGGEQRTGAFFAVWSVATKAAQALAAGLALGLLSWVGFDATQVGGNDPAALTTLAWLYAGAPVALKLIAVALMWNFPLDETAQAAARARLERGDDPEPAP
ncbi:MAG: MFS transporter, partial [Pseudomonadota bacterium]